MARRSFSVSIQLIDRTPHPTAAASDLSLILVAELARTVHRVPVPKYNRGNGYREPSLISQVAILLLSVRRAFDRKEVP